jgi:hypothetical protein
MAAGISNTSRTCPQVGIGSKRLEEQACVVNSMTREFSGRMIPAQSRRHLKKERQPFIYGRLADVCLVSHLLLCEILMK